MAIKILTKQQFRDEWQVYAPRPDAPYYVHKTKRVVESKTKRTHRGYVRFK